MKDVECRLAEEKDTWQVKNLWSICFDDKPAFVDWYFERYYRPEQTLGIFKDEKLLASAQVIPYTIQLRGTEVNAGYIVGVNTLEEHAFRAAVMDAVYSACQRTKEMGK